MVSLCSCVYELRKMWREIMEPSARRIDVYLEIGQKRTFARALAWPGWCRSGRTADAALQALFDAAPRYARVLAAAQLPFQPPADVAAFAVVERCTGNTTTDFEIGRASCRERV